MLTVEKLNALKEQFAKAQASLMVEEVAYGYAPFVNTDGGISLSTVAYMHQYVKNSDKVHTTYIAYHGDKFTIGCSHEYLEGLIDDTSVDSIIDATLEQYPEEVQSRVESKLKSTFGAVMKNASCTNTLFVANLTKWVLGDTLRDNAKITCDHIANMLAHIDVEQEAKQLKKLYADVSKVEINNDDVIKYDLQKFGFRGECYFISGHGGEGKTQSVKEFAIDSGYEFVEVHGHPEIEAIDLYGSVAVAEDGSKGHADGPVSRAARKALKRKTLLFIDEATSIPMAEFAGLKAAFEPFRGYYTFNTGRKLRDEDGILYDEQLKVPVTNLMIVAAGNIGAGEASEEMAKAMKQRFMIYDHVASDKKIKDVLTGIAKAKGFSPSIADKMLAFRKQTKVLAKNGILGDWASLRHLSRKTMELAETEDEVDELIMKQALQWVERDIDGVPIEEQLEALQETVSDIFN